MMTFLPAKLAMVKRVLALAGAAMLLGMAGEARGQTTTTWNGTVNSDWNLIGNWFLTVPTSLDTVYIDTNGTVQPILNDETGFANNLYVGENGTSGTNTLVTVNGGSVLTVGGTFIVGDQFGAMGAVTTTDPDTEMYLTNGGIVGNASVGLLTVGDSSTVDGGGEELDLGEYAGSSGTVDVNGGTLGNVSTLVVGVSGAGNLTVENEGNVSATSVVVSQQALGSGNVTVDGTGSNLYAGTLNLGFFGNGTMALDHGGKGTTTSQLYLGAYMGTTGTLTVNGTGSTFTAGGEAYIGGAGTGNLSITNGGVFNGNTAGISVGDQSTGVGNVSVDGSGSQLLLGGVTSYVGNSGNGTLSVTNGAVVDGGGNNLDLGESGTGDGTVSVDGVGSVLGNITTLKVGDAGTGKLSVTNGGNVTVGNFLTLGASSEALGTVTVDGAGSVLTAANTVNVGGFGSGNVTVTNGGLVDAGANIVVLGNHAGGSGNVTVDGANSTLHAGGGLIVGNEGNGTLSVTNGGLVVTGGLELGDKGNTTGTLTVNGTGSALTNTMGYDLNVGYSGNGTMNVTNSGLVDAGTGSVIVGGNLTGNGSVLVDNASFGNISELDVGYAGNGTATVQNGGNMSAGQVEIGDLSGGNGAMLVTGAGTIFNASSLVVGDSGNGALAINASAIWDNGGGPVDEGDATGSNGAIVVDGGTFQNIGAFDVACCGNGTLAILAGGNVVASSMDIGVQGMGENGSVVVDGAGSTLYLTVGSGSTGLTVGDGATGAMLVSNMALVDLGGADLVVGEQSGNYGNLTVDNGTVQNVGNFTAGDNGIGNVTVDDGGNLSAAMIVVGNQTGSVGNLTVTGTGSIVSSMGYPVDVGLNGNATMQILANGTVDNDHAYSYVGYAANGTVTVDHGTWENIGTLFVGAGSGGTGSVTVQNGGSVGAFAYDVGSATGSVGNMTVTGTGSVATVTDSGGVATVGDNGNGTLLISSNGTFDNGATPATLGNNLGVNGSATVDDGTWKNITTLTVGEAGNGSVLVDDAATVTASTLVAGDQNGSLGNIDITGPNTTVTMDGTGSATLIGNAGSANMSVTDFAILDNGGQDAQIGADATGSGNVSVSGGGQWKNVGDITVGYDGTGTLTVTSSGSLTADNIFLGYDGASSSGLVTVSGANTTVGVTGYIEVGANGPGEFDIKNGANVTAGYVTLADDVGGPGNMTVDGTNSKLQVTNTLEVGEDDLGNLTISGGANVTVGSDTEIGGQSTGTGNVDVTGDNSVLTTNGLLVGTFGNGTLTVENGGVVTVTPGNSIAFTLAGGTGTVNVGSAGMLQVGGTDGIDPGSGTSTFNMLGGTVQVIGSDFSTAINATLAASTTSIIDTNGLNATWAGNIAGGGKLSKYGIGTLTLSGVDTYTGCTTVTLGRLDVTGSLVSVVSVSSGATLGGNGTASNSVTLATGASVAPGYGGPSLTLGNLTWGGSMNGTATAFFTLSDVDSTASLLTVLGNFAKGAGTTFKFNFDGTGTGSTASPVQYTLISFGTLFDAGNGTFLISDFSYQDLGSGPNESGTFAYSGNNLTFTVVPEPGMGAMVVGLVVMGVGLVKRRRR